MFHRLACALLLFVPATGYAQEPVATFPAGEAVLHLTFAKSDDTVIFGGKEGTVKSINVKTKNERILFRHPRRLEINSLAVSPNGEWLAIGCQDGKLPLLNLKTDGKQKSFDQSAPVVSLAFSSDGKLLAIGTGLRFKVINLFSKKKLVHERRKDAAFSVAFVDNDSKLCVPIDDDIEVFSVRENKTHRLLKGQKYHVFRLAVSPDGALLASGHALHEIKLWDLKAFALMKTLKGNDRGVFGIAFAPNGKVMASVGGDGTIRCWNIGQIRNPATVEAQVVIRLDTLMKGVDFSRDGRLLATGGYDGKIRIWDVKALGKQLAVE